MRKFILRLLRWIFLGLISLRYKVRKENMELLESEILQGKPVLLLPNHTSLLDGLLIAITVNLRFDLRPLVLEGYYKSFFFRPIAKLLNAIQVPNLLTSISQEKIEKTKELVDIVCDAFDKQGHVLLFPSGRMKHTEEELIGGRSLAYEILKRNPDLDLILVRISGMYGSHLSREGNKNPFVMKEAVRFLSVVCANGIFFAPRRRLLVEFKHSKGEVPLESKQKCNAYLEAFYNQFPEDITFKDIEKRQAYEKIVRTKGHFLLKTKEIEQVQQRFIKKQLLIEDHILPQSVKSDIYYKISEITGKPVGEIDQLDHLVYKLGMDSLDVASLYSHLDSNYELDPSTEPGDLETVQDVLMQAVNAEKMHALSNDDEVFPSKWKSEVDRLEPCYLEADTLIEAFLKQSKRMNGSEIVADPILGSMDFKTMRRAVIILARSISKLEEEHVGIMLPSTIGCQLMILATQLAKKIPVMINWTIGSHFTNYVIKKMDLKTIITSKKFLKKVKADLGNALDILLFTEDMKDKLSLSDKLVGAWTSAQAVTTILESFGADKIDKDDTAVILFTSGSTGHPKGVPLTHRNIQANHKGAMSNLDIRPSDAFMIPLPPFHVFGFMVSLLAIILGAKTIFYPDPLDAQGFKKEIMKWAASVYLFCTHIL